jgi:hypothetical protein
VTITAAATSGGPADASARTRISLMDRTFGVLLIVLLCSVDSSITASIAIFREFAWTPWLYRVPFAPLSAFSVADLVILALTAWVAWRIGMRGRLALTPYLALGVLASIYAAFGLLYVLSVYPAWKPWVFDMKVLLLLFVPYLFLRLTADATVRRWFSPTRIWIYLFVAGAIDTLLTYTIGLVERGAFLGMPIVNPIIPPIVPLIWAFFARRPAVRMAMIALFIVTTLNTLNRAAYIPLFNTIVATAAVTVFLVRMPALRRVTLLVAMITLLHGLSVLAIRYGEHVPLVRNKADGAQIRHTQWENFVRNSEGNLFAVTGKGIGSTWFEYVRIEDPAGFSMGASISSDWEATRYSPVKFIYNWTAPALLQKWGIAGGVALLFVISMFYARLRDAARRTATVLQEPGHVRAVVPHLLIATVFIIENFTFVGALAASLVTSLLAWDVERRAAGSAGATAMDTVRPLAPLNLQPATS